MSFEISAHCILLSGLQFFVNLPSRLCIPTDISTHLPGYVTS